MKAGALELGQKAMSAQHRLGAVPSRITRFVSASGNAFCSCVISPAGQRAGHGPKVKTTEGEDEDEDEDGGLYLEELGEDGKGGVFVVHALAVGHIGVVGLVAR
jgi:hypothetical protein